MRGGTEAVSDVGETGKKKKTQPALPSVPFFEHSYALSGRGKKQGAARSQGEKKKGETKETSMQ